MTQPAPLDVGQFFSQFSSQYDQTILTAIAPYHDILQTLVAYAFLEADTPCRILDLGCGTGNLSALLAKLLPQATLTLVDLSAEMLAEAKPKLEALGASYTLVQQDFSSLQLPTGSFDLVVSSFALHHLGDEAKRALYHQIFAWLAPGGRLRFADGVLGLPQAAYALNTQGWTDAARNHGATEESIRMWLDHEDQFDYFAPLASHFEWLRAAGFIDIDCFWKKYHWAVMGCTRP